MTFFQLTALALAAVWLLVTVVWFRRSRVVLAAGLLGIGLYTLIALVSHRATLDDLGLESPHSWLLTIVLAVAWLGLTLAYSPVADWLATGWVKQPPTLDSFHVIQQSKAKLVGGIMVAWILGGFLEELVARGIVLKSLESLLAPWLTVPVAAGLAVCIAALGAGALHLYQGPRAVVIITQISVLFGILFVVSGYRLWAVILCHGVYDSVAFVRFANKRSKYSNP